MEYLLFIGVLAAMGLFMGGLALLIIAHHWPPTFTIHCEVTDITPLPYDDHDPADDWKR